MKKILFTGIAIAVFSAISIAQQTNADGTPVNPPPAPVPVAKVEISKEEKAAMKAKQDSALMEAFKGAGLTDVEIKSAKQIMAEASKKSSELKNNIGLGDVEREAAKKQISDEKNDKLKALMGEDKYKLYSEFRKKQKEAAAATPKATTN